VRELLDLLNAAGHVDFRDARGPLGFTQRQAGGRFTRDEAEAFIDQLRAEAEAEAAGEPGAPRDDGPDTAVRPAAEPARRLSATERTLRAIPAEQLAAELQRRGWIVVEP
jgi:hypothetical protein